MSSSFLCQGKYKAVAAVHYLSRFFSQRQESCVETHPTKRRIHRDILKFRTLHFSERGSKWQLKKFICQLYGYLNE